MTLARNRHSDSLIYAIDQTTNEEIRIGLSFWHECKQPDRLDSEEFNVLIPDLNVRVSSIDLEFKKESND